MIAVAAMLCGRKTQAGIARWAKGLRPDELACLGIRQRRTPCPATWCLFFQSLEAVELERCLGRWVTGAKRGYIGHVAIDGKCLRGSRNGDGQATYLLSAFSAELQGVIGTVRVRAAGSELSGMLELLKTIPLEGATITGDAAFTRRSVARAVLKGGGNYFLTVKGNHKMLRDDIAGAFRSAPYQRFFSAGLDKAESRDRGHGRREHRVLEALPVSHGYSDWPGAAQICRIRRTYRKFKRPFPPPPARPGRRHRQRGCRGGSPATLLAKASDSTRARHACAPAAAANACHPPHSLAALHASPPPCHAAPRPAHARPLTPSGTPVSAGGRGPVNAAPWALAAGACIVRAGLPPRPSRLPGIMNMGEDPQAPHGGAPPLRRSPPYLR